MEPILTSSQDFEAEKRSSYNGNVPSPPEVHVHVPSSPASSVAVHQVMSEPLFSITHDSASSRQIDQVSSNVTSPTDERRRSLLGDTEYVRELTEVLNDLERQHDAIEMTPSAALATYGETLTTSAALAPPLQAPKLREAQFLRSARRFLDLIQIPMLRELLEKIMAPQTKVNVGNVDVPDHALLSDPQSPKSRTLPPLLELYYEAAGEVKLQGDALVNLDYWYAEEVTTRDFQQDQGLEVSVPDDVFHDEYLHKRALIAVSLDRHIDEAERLRTQCIAAGLDLDAGMRVPDDSEADLSEVLLEDHEDDVLSLSDPGPVLRPLDVEFSNRLRSGGMKPAARSMLGLAGMNEHVSRWMADLETPGIEHSQQPLLGHSQDVNDANELQSIYVDPSQLVHECASQHSRGASEDDKGKQFEDAGVTCERGRSFNLAGSSIARSAASSWVNVVVEEAQETLGRLHHLDLASAPCLDIDIRANRRVLGLWGEDTKDTKSTTTPKAHWSTLLGDTLADARTWLSKLLTSAPPTP
ncbi:hypothetical protein B0A48_15768 [Cryoendolithus antarcticus]|uniref:Uncharacterized protein n=1 Tax=Cryoendolithus antarcticus TaxID=1507870 RepID=A0A1V8SHJ2_9PEZI|nr:hypothetical protein B0A48_15768 [Cryoendolithus antarcticus]